MVRSTFLIVKNEIITYSSTRSQLKRHVMSFQMVEQGINNVQNRHDSQECYLFAPGTIPDIDH